MRRFYKDVGKPAEELDRMLMYVVIGTIVGARLGHTLIYDPGYYLSHPLDIIKVWEGGLASHGGGLGIIIALWLYARKSGDRLLWLLDRICIPVAAAGFFIRLGNLFNSEIIGTPTQVPWAVVFDLVGPQPVHPVMVYESLVYGLIFIVLWQVYQRIWRQMRNGTLFGLFLMLVFAARFLLEFVKTEQAAFTLGVPISMGQLLSVPFFIAGVVFFVRARKSG